MDYKELLRKYIAYVGDCEGTDFIDEANPYAGDLTKEEKAELGRLSYRYDENDAHIRNKRPSDNQRDVIWEVMQEDGTWKEIIEPNPDGNPL